MKDEVSRRGFVAGGMAASGALAAPAAQAPETAGQSTVLTVDWRRLVSRADLTYDKPVNRPEEGMPVGNGRMGSLVWTTPSALHFQINRADVHAMNCATNSFPRASTDYASGCGYVDIDFGGITDDLFAGAGFSQHLAVYDAVMTARGTGVTARVLAWNDRDVFAIEIEDRRPQPERIDIDLRTLRYSIGYTPKQNYERTRRREVVVETAAHTASSRLDIRGGRIALIQQFREDEYYDSSAVVIGANGRQTKARYVNDSTVRLSVAPGTGKFTILIASDESRDPNQDTAAAALAELEAAQAKGFEGLLAANRAWWHKFWAKGFVRLRSQDHVADYVEQYYTWFLYVMASSSRGAYPPRFGGMLWFVNGDMRQWGSEHWQYNLGCYYTGLIPSNRLELMDPMFRTYSGMYERCAEAARAQWGSKGVWLPETTWFDGQERLPDDIAAEMWELYLLRKPWDQRSERFLRYAEPKQTFDSRWNWIDHQVKGEHGEWQFADKGRGPFGHVTHIFSATAKNAFLYWLRYDCTRDKEWLREHAYPMLKGTVEFYRNFPNLRKEADGKYHIHHVNNHEGSWNSSDTQEELPAILGIVASTTDPHISCVDARGNGDGTTNHLWRYRTEGIVEESCPAIYGNKLYVLSADRYLYAIQ